MTYSKEEKAMWLEDWRQSGKSAWTYAKENGLIPQTFVTWAKKFAKEKSGFVEIKQQERKPRLNAPGIVIEKGDLKIHLPFGISSNDLSAVIESLELSVRRASI